MTTVDPRAVLPLRRRGDVEQPGAGLLVAIAALVCVAAVAETAAHGLVQPMTALAFAGLIAVGEIVRVRLPGDRELAPVGVAAALAYALLLNVDRQTAHHGAWQVIAVTAFAATLGGLPHLAAGRPARLDDLARRVLLAGVTAGLFRPFADHLRGDSTTRSWRCSERRSLPLPSTPSSPGVGAMRVGTSGVSRRRCGTSCARPPASAWLSGPPAYSSRSRPDPSACGRCRCSPFRCS